VAIACSLLALAVAAARCADSTGAGADGGACGPSDQDGLNGGSSTLDLTVDDDAFAPIILKAQNLSTVTLTLSNTGTRPHDFVVDCLPTPNDNGCPTTSCFPDAAVIPAVAPGASASTTFVTPNPEGIYDFRSDLPGDTMTGQFVVQ
jgi:hypothetical protein